ncbi:orotidine-5'-phosphate decarboxylase [Pseudonocardiaceae bacterium YIM PH 21723]|nr:orotidine-5'-phosphate decarboxylase [Pseudonocardiaceae bacterium YIM PH 21723]
MPVEQQERFGARLTRAIEARGRLCVGVDPHRELLESWGLSYDAEGLQRFADICVEALAPEIAVLKPQSAFFEVFGSRGVAVLEDFINRAREAGTLVLLDAKRGDIGSTMAGYAEAFLGESAVAPADALTVSPYLGFGSLEPALAVAEATGRGLFVLALTSNPEGASVQRATAASGRPVAEEIALAAARRNAGVSPLGDVGLVVGATIGSVGFDLGALNGPILAPGLGAQGATPSDLQTVFGDHYRSVLPTTSRGVLRHGPDVNSLRSAALAARDELLSAETR